MKLKNPNGRVVSVTPSMFERYKRKKGWKEVADSPKSTDHTIAELREMKPDVKDWDSFIEGDGRKSVSQI